MLRYLELNKGRNAPEAVAILTLKAEVAMMTNPNGIRICSLSARFALLAATLLSNLALTYGVSQGVTSCPVTRLPGGESIREGLLDSQPYPLPSVDVVPGGGNFSSAEYGLLDRPYTTAAAYGAQYSSGSLVETYEPTRNLPCVASVLRLWMLLVLSRHFTTHQCIPPIPTGILPSEGWTPTQDITAPRQ